MHSKSLLSTLAFISLSFGISLSSGPVAAAQQAPAEAGEAAANTVYQLGPDDEIEVKVFGQDNLGFKTRINGDGTISVPLIGIIPATGRTTSDLSRYIAAQYQQNGILVQPSVSVEVTSYSSKMVTVLGAVDQAGLYALDRPYSAAAIIAKAGGVRQDGANAVLLTPAGSTESRRLSLTSTPGAATYMMQPGDTLFVPPAEVVYVYGQVNDPGSFTYMSGMTFRQALAKAGGPTVAGSTRKYDVKRNGQTIRPELDDLIQPDDVLIIKEKLF